MNRHFDGGGDFDLAVGCVTGYRWWVLPREHLPEHAGLLLGATGRQLWLPGDNEAFCNFNRRHWPPVEPCGCGFYAYWTHTVRDLGLAGVQVMGAVEGFGHTLIGDDGFRCERARIIALHVPPDGVMGPLLGRLRLRHPAWAPDRAVMVGGARLQPGGREVFRAITGRDAWLDSYSVRERVQDREERDREMAAVREVAAARLGEVEAQLGQAYPEAEICATLPYLLLKHPPSGRP